MHLTLLLDLDLAKLNVNGREVKVQEDVRDAHAPQLLLLDR